MSLARFVKCSVAITFLILVYIHLQMQIVDLAYQGQLKEMQIKDLVDKNGSTFYAISKLKSAHHLGGRLLSENSKMQFAGADNIIYASAEDLQDDNSEHQLQAGKNANIFANLLSFATQAEAKNGE